MRQTRSVWLVLLLDPEKPNNQINETDQTDEIDRIDQMNKTGWLNFFSILLVGWLASQFIHMPEMNAWAGSPPSPKSQRRQAMPSGVEQSSTGRECATTAMALMGARINDRNSQPTPPRSSRSSIRNRSI